jgi:hypothetical protein
MPACIRNTSTLFRQTQSQENRDCVTLNNWLNGFIYNFITSAPLGCGRPACHLRRPPTLNLPLHVAAAARVRLR